MNSLRRSSAWNATVLVGAWLVLVVVLPAAINIAAGLLHPLPSRVEMITAQREASNDAVNRRSELLARYLEDHPEMASGVVAEEPGLGALAWAATDAVNGRLEEVTAVHDARRAEQLALIRRYRFLSPALLAQGCSSTPPGRATRASPAFSPRCATSPSSGGSSSCRRSSPTSA